MNDNRAASALHKFMMLSIRFWSTMDETYLVTKPGTPSESSSDIILFKECLQW